MRTTANIRINLILPESRVIGLFFVADTMGLSLFKFSWWAIFIQIFVVDSERRMCFENSAYMYNGPSGSSKVVDFGNNRKRVCDFLLVINSNVRPILPRFRDIAGFLLKTAPHPYSVKRISKGVYTALLYTARYDSTLCRSLADSQLILMLPLLRLLLARPIGCGLQS